MVRLQTPYLERLLLERLDALYGGLRCRKCGRDRYTILVCSAANGHTVIMGDATQRRVDHQLNFPRANRVEGVGCALADLLDPLNGDAVSFQKIGGSLRCQQRKTHLI